MRLNGTLWPYGLYYYIQKENKTLPSNYIYINNVSRLNFENLKYYSSKDMYSIFLNSRENELAKNVSSKTFIDYSETFMMNCALRKCFSFSVILQNLYFHFIHIHVFKNFLNRSFQRISFDTKLLNILDK